MDLPFANTTGPVPVDELRTVPTLEGLDDALFDWLGEHGAYLEIPVGEKMFVAGMPAEQMMIQLAGAVQLVLDVGGQPLLFDTFRGKRVTGMLPYSRMTEYTGTGLVIEPVRVVLVWKKDFPAMLETSEELGRRLVALMSDRVREATRSSQQREKMMALGKLSAGLAHELNNPAAAIRRAVADLEERVAALPELVARMSEHGLTAEQVRKASGVQAEVAATDENRLAAFIAPLSAAGARISLFVGADERQLEAASRIGAPVVELHTGAYCDAETEADRAAELARLREMAQVGADLGLEVHAGHGLTFDSVGPIAAIPEIAELNIGHFLIGEAIFAGLDTAIHRMRALMDRARDEEAA